MKKSKKLLSVLLAVLMLLSSMSVMASAARANYKTHDELVELKAYSPYGQVTRLDTETRLSMIFDMLDNVLADANINPGQLFNLLGLSLTVDLRSVDALCGTLDSASKLLGNFLVTIFGGLLGIVKDLKLDNWQTGMTRDSVPQMKILTELCEVLRDNAGVVSNIIKTGKVNLGLANSALSGLDLSIIADIPALLKGMIFPMFERKDDDQTQIAALMNTKGNGGLQTVLNNFVKGLFTKPQSTTTYKEDAEGKCISGHKLPTQDDNLRYYYVKGNDEGRAYFECYYYDTETGSYVAEDEKFYQVVESEGVYTYRKESGDGLKYYKEGSYWLNSVAEAIKGNPDLVDLTKNSAASLLYNMIPYVFAEMAPVVLNGSVKKLLAEALGATYTYVGDFGSPEVEALGSDDFFTKEQGDYIWEWTDYAVISGVHYYRYEDKFYKGDISGVNPFFELIDWDYKITENFVNDFVPGADGTASTAGYPTLLQGLNAFLVKAANTIMEDSFEKKVALVTGDNTNLIANVKKAAQAVLEVSPETIFGKEYNDPGKYYSLVMSNNDQEVLIGIACTVIQMLMPQMILPKADTIIGKDYTIGAILAAVLRELATQLLPTHNYDALIYDNYNTKTLLTGKDNSYWLDVILTMGTDIGVYYLKNLADMGEDTTAWQNGMPYEETKTYAAGDLTVSGGLKVWEARVDYIVDWALSTSTDELWAWHFDRLVDSGVSIDLAVVQDPWVKLGNIFKSLLPVDQILNVTFDDHWLETVLKDNLVLAIADLHPEKISNMLNIPQGSVLRQTNVFTQLATVLRNFVNGLLKKVAKVDLIPANVTDFDALLNQNTIATIVETLLKNLLTAVNNGLLDPVLPIVNFFAGWTTDPQKYAEPTLFFSNPNGYAYILASGSSASTTLNIRNDSSGMLEEHKGASADLPYYVVIDSIKSDDDSFTTDASYPVSVAPGGTAAIGVSMNYSEEKEVEILVTYRFLFKDGKEVGSAQKRTTYQFVSDITPDGLAVTSGTEDDSVKQGDYKPVIFTKDIYGAITGEVGVLTNTATVDIFGSSKKSLASSTVLPEANGEPKGYGGEYFRHNTKSEATSEGLAGSISKGDSTSLYLYKPQANVTADTKFPYGTYDMGSIGVKYGNRTKVWTQDFIYYNDYNIAAVADSYSGYDFTASDFTTAGQAAYKEFIDALKDADRLATLPMKVDTYVDDIMPQIPLAIDRLEKAYKAAIRYLKPVDSTLELLETALATAEPGGETPEINYQDYRLYEYFNYEDYRTEVRNRIKEYQGPVAPEQYIPGSSLYGKAVDELLEAEDNAKLKLALGATVIQPSDEEMEAYQAAVGEWQEPQYTDLENGDVAQRLGYYKQFLQLKAVNKQFLNKEIDYANAQGYVAEQYSKDSWAAYEDALKNAQTVAAKDGALQSEVFDAKYALMVAENQLLAADKSAKDNGALETLQELIEKANDIFENSDNYKVKDEMNETDAYKQLIEALGYDTGDEILYDYSALTFIAYDRETTQNNLDRIKAAEEKLQAAINNFESLAADPDIFPKEVEGGTTDGVVDTEHSDGIHVGYLYGVEAGEPVDEVFGSSTSLKVIANDAGYENGTGAIVQVLYPDGRVYEEYILIIFGDLNGDGQVDATDRLALTQGVGGTSELSNIQNFAGDLNTDGEADATDRLALTQALSGASDITKNPYA